MSLRTFSLSAATALLLASAPLAPPAAAAEFSPVDVSDATSIEDAVELEVGTLDEPARYSLEVEAAAGMGLENVDDTVFLRVDIPVGQRLHAAYRIEPDQAADGTQVGAELIDAEGYLSDFDKVDTVNDQSSPTALRSGFLISDVMGPENRSYGRETLLRLNPSARDDGEIVPVELTLTSVPEVVDGGSPEDVDRPKMRYPDDVQPVSEDDASQVIEETIAPGATQYHPVEVDWMEAIDATATVTDRAAADQNLCFSLFNRIDEQLVVVGEQVVPANSPRPVNFGQRTPGHYKNADARNKTRTTGFLDGPVHLAVTNTSDEEVGYRVLVTPRGPGLDVDATPPAFDPAAAEREQEQLDEVDHDYHMAAGLEESQGTQLPGNPLLWLAGGLVLVAVILALFAARGRRG